MGLVRINNRYYIVLVREQASTLVIGPPEVRVYSTRWAGQRPSLAGPGHTCCQPWPLGFLVRLVVDLSMAAEYELSGYKNVHYLHGQDKRVQELDKIMADKERVETR